MISYITCLAFSFSEQIEYLLKKLTEAMGSGWHQEQFELYKISLNANWEGLSAWELIELIGSGQFSKGMDRQTVSMAVNEVFNELILDVLKQVRLAYESEHSRICYYARSFWCLRLDFSSL